jgi:hypothetical protein
MNWVCKFVGHEYDRRIVRRLDWMDLYHQRERIEGTLIPIPCKRCKEILDMKVSFNSFGNIKLEEV